MCSCRKFLAEKPVHKSWATRSDRTASGRQRRIVLAAREAVLLNVTRAMGWSRSRKLFLPLLSRRRQALSRREGILLAEPLSQGVHTITGVTSVIGVPVIVAAGSH